MGHERPVVCVFIIIMILFTFLTPFSNAVLSIEKELFLDKSPFWGEMQYRFKKYLETGDYLWKVHPLDISFLKNANESDILYIEVYTLNPKKAVIQVGDVETDEPPITYHVYQATDAQVSELKKISYLYISIKACFSHV